MKKVFFTAVAVFFMLSSGQLWAQKTINWIAFSELEEAMAKDPKPVFVDLYTDWCGWCKKMDKSTFRDAKFVAYINKNYHAVKFNAEQKEDVVFMGRTYSFVPSGRRGYHELAAEVMQGQMSYPTYVILTEEFKILQSFKGYRTASEFLPIVTFLGDRHYENTTWKEFSAHWKGSD